VCVCVVGRCCDDVNTLCVCLCGYDCDRVGGGDVDQRVVVWVILRL